MLIWENVVLALNGLKSNIMRTLLTMLGIIIGIASVIAIMTVGNSITVMVNTMMQEFGANNIVIGLNYRSDLEDDYYPDLTEDDLITDEMIDGYLEVYGDKVEYVLKSETVGQGRVEDGKKYANVNVTGTNKDNFKYLRLDILAGREMLDKDYENAKNVCLVSDYYVNNMFAGNLEAALGQPAEVKMGDYYCTFYIVGVYKYSNSYSMGSAKDTRTTMYVPFESAKNITHNTSGFTNIEVVTTVGTDNASFASMSQAFFSRFYEKNENFEVKAFNMESMMDSVNTMIGSIETALAIIAGISLLVGGIGVMNIMLVSITERTKEIGTRKALGATNSSIRLQFITESVVICIIGGIIGIILGVGLGYLGLGLLGYTAAVSPQSIVIAVGFSMFIGIFFGYYPANKAAKLNPIDALRYE